MVLPFSTPLTTPEDDPTEASAEAADDQVPPAVASLNVTEEPWHTVAGPVIDAGNA